MIINLRDNLYYDLEKGVASEKAQKSILFASKTSLRRYQTTDKYRRNIGGQWISSSSISLTLLVGYYMLKTGVKRVGAFYRLDEEKHIVMEFSMTQDGIKATWDDFRESPEEWLDVHKGRSDYFDAIFGNTALRNASPPVDLDSLCKQFSDSRLKLKIAAAVGVAAASAAILWFGFLRPEPKPVVVAQPQAQAPVALTETQISALRALTFAEMIGEYNQMVNSLESDTYVSQVSITMEANDKVVSSKMTVRYHSYYPYEGSSREGDLYVWNKDYSLQKGATDVKPVKLRESRECLGRMLDLGWTVQQRDRRAWQMSLAEPSHAKFITAFNAVIGCPLHVKSLTMLSDKNNGEVSLDYGSL